MPQLILTVNTVATNAAGGQTRMREEVDVWADLPATIKTVLVQLTTIIPQKVVARYGEGSVVEGMQLIPDQTA